MKRQEVGQDLRRVVQLRKGVDDWDGGMLGEVLKKWESAGCPRAWRGELGDGRASLNRKEIRRSSRATNAQQRFGEMVSEVK